MAGAVTTKKQQKRTRTLHLAGFRDPELPGKYPTALGLAQSAKPDQAELARVIRAIEAALLIPSSRVYSVVLDALYQWARVHEVEGLPFTKATEARFDDRWGDRYRRWQEWYERLGDGPRVLAKPRPPRKKKSS